MANETVFPEGIALPNISGGPGTLLSIDNQGVVGPSLSLSQNMAGFYNGSNLEWDDGTIQTGIIDQTQYNPGSLYTLASNEVTINQTGLYLVKIDITLFGLQSNRTDIRSWLALNGIEVAGTSRRHYCRQTGYGASSSATAIININSSDTIGMRFERTFGSAQIRQEANGSYMYIEKRD